MLNLHWVYGVLGINGVGTLGHVRFYRYCTVIG